MHRGEVPRGGKALTTSFAVNRASFELSKTFQPFRMIAVYQDSSNLSTQFGHDLSNPPREPKDNFRIRGDPRPIWK